MDTLRFKENKQTYQRRNKTWFQIKTQWPTNKTRHAPWLAVHTDTISTLWSHTHAKEREEAHVVRVAVQEGQIVLFLHSNRQNRCYKALHLNSPRLKETRWAVQGLAGSKCRRRRIRDEERSGLHAEWSEACLSKREKRKWCEALWVKPAGLTSWKQQFQFWRLQ